MTVAVETIMDQIFELMLRICGFCWSEVVAVQAGEGVGLKEKLYHSRILFFWNSQIILLWNTAALKYDAYLNLGDWKFPLENNPGYCLFAAYNNLNRIMVSNIPSICRSYLIAQKIKRY